MSPKNNLNCSTKVAYLYSHGRNGTSWTGFSFSSRKDSPNLQFHVRKPFCIVHFAQIFDIATTNALRTSQNRLSSFFCRAFKVFLQRNRISRTLDDYHKLN
jgi:hypothetical protein